MKFCKRICCRCRFHIYRLLSVKPELKTSFSSNIRYLISVRKLRMRRGDAVVNVNQSPLHYLMQGWPTSTHRRVI